MEKKVKLCYMDTDSFIVYINTGYIYSDTASFQNTSNYELDRPLPKGKNKKVINFIKDELGGKIVNLLY